MKLMVVANLETKDAGLNMTNQRSQAKFENENGIRENKNEKDQ